MSVFYRTRWTLESRRRGARLSMLGGDASVLDVNRPAVPGPGGSGRVSPRLDRAMASAAVRTPLGGDPPAVGDRVRVRDPRRRTRERGRPHLPRAGCRAGARGARAGVAFAWCTPGEGAPGPAAVRARLGRPRRPRR